VIGWYEKNRPRKFRPDLSLFKVSYEERWWISLSVNKLCVVLESIVFCISIKFICLKTTKAQGLIHWFTGFTFVSLHFSDLNKDYNVLTV
jgi:hypothetical protein